MGARVRSFDTAICGLTIWPLTYSYDLQYKNFGSVSQGTCNFADIPYPGRSLFRASRSPNTVSVMK